MKRFVIQAFSRTFQSTHWIVLAAAAINAGAVGFSSAGEQEIPGFNAEIRPILADKCFPCHGPDAGNRQADLRLDSFAAATSGNGSSTAIVPGDLDASEVWQRIVTDDESLRMPPAESQKQLSEAEKESLRRWITGGAEYQAHWSFEPIAEVVPPVGSPDLHNPIDLFIEPKLEKLGLNLSPVADRSTLLRRLSFALTGLPPESTSLQAWLNDSQPDATERAIAQMIDLPAYGEEMARHWLDMARYGDTHGLHLDNERQMWAYRDWVVRSFNRNQPFDRFTIEQLAGDLLPEPSQEQLIATGFNRCNVTSSEGGAIDEEFHFRYAVDRTSTTAQTWLGLTAGCAVCHDHKFDPISAREFYSLYAFFYSSADPAMDGNALLTNPVLKLETDDDRAKLEEFDRQIGAQQLALEQRAAQLAYDDPALAQPVAGPSAVEQVWMDDDFPPSGKSQGGPGAATVFVSAESGEKVFSGQRALKRTDSGLAQDVWSDASVPLVVPASAKIFAHVRIDPENPPKALMLQFFKGGWLHRAVWGDYNIIEWGASETHERVAMGAIPAPGDWARLEIPVEKIGLQAGDKLTGFATTQYGGTVYWDKVGVEGLLDPANDPSRSFTAWWRTVGDGKPDGLPNELLPVAKAGATFSGDAALKDRLKAWYLALICESTRQEFLADLKTLQTTLESRKAFHEAIPSTFIFRDREQPRDSHVMLRGQYDQRGEQVFPGVPAILPPLNHPTDGKNATRLDLAQWLVDDANPLTARVAVNRIWQQLFGTGLVRSSGDFGTQGELPSHPELLDWLANHFRESGWDVKALVRLIVSSRTFQQSSAVSPQLLELDPENRWLARGPRMRLDAEQIRDNVLFVSGLLDPSMGGKGVRPYQPDNVWEPVGYIDSNTRNYKRDSGAALYRRSLYTFFKRTAPPPYMANFDAPNREQPCTRREKSNTPLQALQLLNDVQHVEAARRLAERVLTEGGGSVPERLAFIYRTVLAREPNAAEIALLSAQLAEHEKRYNSGPDDAKALISMGESKANEQLKQPELAAWTLACSTILNLDETVTRN